MKKLLYLVSLLLVITLQAGFSQENYSIRIENVDDLGKAYLNNKKILEVPYSKSKTLNITSLLQEGENEIKFTLTNNTGGIAYGFYVMKGDSIMYKQVCGKVGKVGCERNKIYKNGLIKEFSYTLSYKSSNKVVEETKPNRPNFGNLYSNNPKKDAAIANFNNYYLSSELTRAELNWTGDVTTCKEGTTSKIAKEKILQRINYFRRLAGISDNVTLNLELSTNSQKAALMMKANNSLSHTPPTSWKCYTEIGKSAAGSSNIALGVFGSNAINLYVDDGEGELGHRRWILFPSLSEIGTGDTDNSNVLYVFGSKRNTDYIKPSFVAYPPDDYIPSILVFRTWSISVDGADFAKATVTIIDSKKNIIKNKSYIPTQGYGLNTFCFIPEIKVFEIIKDVAYTVTVSNVKVGTEMKNYSYTVNIFNP
jgi:uncharacterized protein YkwD